MTDLHELSALEQAAAVRNHDVGPVELVEHALRRVEDRSATLGAFVTVTPERALAAAATAERALRAAADTDALPPLLGVPTAIKDLTMTAGIRTTFGSVVYRDFVPDVDDDVVRLLRAAGTISLGKTAVPEFGLPCYTEPAGGPPAVTPWDTTRLAGGSSGGAAAAVAGGLVPFAHGSDGGGSIRIPASVCGLVGLKSSRGRVSPGPMGGDPLGMAVSGPLARTVADAAAMLDAMAVPQLGDMFQVPPLPPGQTFLGAARRADPGRLRIGRYADVPVPGVVVEPDCAAAYEQAAGLFAELGHEVIDVVAPFSEQVVAAFETMWAVLAHSHPVGQDDEPRLQPLTRWLRARGAVVTGPELLAVMRGMHVLARAMVAAHSAVDVVLTPSLAQLPRPVGWFTGTGDPSEDFERQKRFTPFTSVYNITGQPALSLPLYWTDLADGPVLPVGVQLIGRPGADALLLALGAQVENARPWAHRTPPTW